MLLTINVLKTPGQALKALSPSSKSHENIKIKSFHVFSQYKHAKSAFPIYIVYKKEKKKVRAALAKLQQYFRNTTLKF